jgi:uncharacterized membrane protein
MRHVKHTERIYERRQQLGFKGRLAPPPTPIDRFADTLSGIFGSVSFLVGNAVFFAVWIVLNSGVIPSIDPFDPFPFNLLTMAVSLQAIGLTIVVLISQNFQSRLSEMRAELDFEINVRAEKEVTKLICMVRQIQDRLGIADASDPELEEMARETDIERIQAEMNSQGK